ncbi:MAG: HAMP domain-containing protein [Gammaproteobacteria bacterium]|nr:HAMP domain-containing protein [Gammaproteobacteria bacterium]
MKLVTQIRVALLLMLMLGLGSAFLSLRSLNQSRLYIERLNIAHLIYEQYLTLESHIYQLFKQYGDAIIIGDSNQRADKSALITQIENDTLKIHHLISSDTTRSEEEKTVALDTLESIDATVKSLITKLDRFSPTGTGELSSDWGRLSNLLNNEIDQGLSQLIDSALQRKANEVRVTTETAARGVFRQQVFAVLFAVVTLLAVLALVLMLNRKITRPIDKLLAGVRKFGDGQFDHRINPVGRDELAEIGSSFDVMAASVAQKNQSLTSENIDLQKAVDERTQQLSVMLDDVRRIDESRKRMIADVSHELRTPLTIIQGEADIALRGSNAAISDYRAALEKTREAATHTARLVDDLLFVARTEAGEVKLDLSAMDLDLLVQETLEVYGQKIEFKSSTSPAPMIGDSGRIRQALLVLLENARHHGGDDVAIALDHRGENYFLHVEDSGPGMSDATKKLAFERYFRGSNAAERYSEGAGLGLPVAMSIAKAHGGTVALSDRAGGGLVATLVLPEATGVGAAA